KTNFLTLASHELKNPLAPLLSQLQMIEDGTLGGLNRDQQEGMEIIHKSADHLVKLVDDILDISRLESGRMRFGMKSIDLNSIIEDVCNAMEPVAREKSISIKRDLGSLPRVRADHSRIRQVLTNYMKNAVKFTNRRGRIYVGSEVQGDSVVVKVKDTGIGVRKSEYHKIFNPFFQAKEVAGKRELGFGLGLTISKGIVEEHGGEVGVESGFGRGSTFWFTLPLKKRSKSNKEPKGRPAGKKATGKKAAGKKNSNKTRQSKKKKIKNRKR
ncbi:MAG: HAMP domain-containing sensor histidine kinase, partial [Candidatus Woesearchaeota archaeon]